MRIRALALTGLGIATLLASCHRSEPPPPPAENDAMVEPEPVAPPEPAPRAVEVPRAEAPPRPKPAPEVSADQQVQDDADATGMTAHVTHGDDAGDGQPASGGGNDQD